MSVENTLVGPELRKGPQGRLTPLACDCALHAVLGCVIATEVAAYLYQFDPVLGASFYGVYPPWMVFVWGWNWHDFDPDVFRLAAGAGGLVTFFLLSVAMVKRFTRVGQVKDNRYLHGSARWATKREVKKMGLFGDEGVCVGGWAKGNRAIPLYHDGPEHVAMIAPSGSGKGISIIVPTLLKWRYSAVITDMKGELAALTAPCRKNLLGNRVLLFEPASPHGSCGFNALEEVRVGTDHEVGDAQNLAALLMDPEGKGLGSSRHEGHWQITATDFLTGCILHHAFESSRRGQVPSLPGLSCMLSDPDQPIAELLAVMIENRRLPEHARRAAAMAAEEQRSRPDKEGGSVLSYARKALTLYRDPIVARNVSGSSFRVRDLMHAKEPVSLYVIVEPVDQTRMMPLVCILLNLITRGLAVKPGFTNGEPKPSYKHPLLLLLDEFPSWGNLGVIAKSMAHLRGYGIRAMIVAQDLAQLEERYGKEQSVTSNCGLQIAFAPNRLETAKHLSEMVGQTTVMKRHQQVSRGGNGSGPNVSDSIQEVGRPLLTADECMRIPGPEKVKDRVTKAGDLIVCVSGKPPIYGRQTPYFMDKDLQKRVAVEAPE